MSDPADQTPFPWAGFKDEELLKMRICDLKLTIEGSELEDRVRNLQLELRARGLKFFPKIYLGDEWFSPEGMLALAIPFYLAHPRLRQLEQTIMLEVEGGTPEYCMKLLRHEAGHCFDHGYRFSKRPKWRSIFGSPDQEYAPETYRPKPYSRAFVQNLENWYAQSHPDEDFAETFATWLNPDLDWKKEYRGWTGALEKLSYVDSLAREVGGKAPRDEKGSLPWNAARMTTTLAKYYAKRRREHATDYPDFYDGDLRRIFNGAKEGTSKREHGAGRYMQKHGRAILESVSYWSGEKKFPIERLVKKLTSRCEELDLRIGRSSEDTLLQVSSYLTNLVTNHLFTGRFKRSV